MAKLRHLFIKPEPMGDLREVDQFELTLQGISNSAPTLPMRHILIVHENTIEEFRLSPGDLRENMVIGGEDETILSPGNMLEIGSTKIRVTFYCEVCGKLTPKVNPGEIKFRRGVLGEVITPGHLRISDQVRVDLNKFEPIPYEIGDRIHWYLLNRKAPIELSQLVRNIGLRNSYCRAVPNIIKKRTDIDASKIIIKSRLAANSAK